MPPADDRLVAQVEHILNSLEGSACYPSDWRDTGELRYVYRQNSILARTRDIERTNSALLDTLVRERDADESAPGGPDQQGEPGIEIVPDAQGFARLTFASRRTTPEVLDDLDQILGAGVATPDHVFYVCGHPCPAEEPEEVPTGTAEPSPAPVSRTCADPAHCDGTRTCDGEDVFVSVVDMGWLPAAANEHYWLAGVQGDEENPSGADGFIRMYAGHGTFVAGCLRVTAPAASVYVEGTLLDAAGAVFESQLIPQLAQALDKRPDIVVFTFATETRLELTSLGFDALVEARAEELERIAFLAPAGNQGAEIPFYPAAYDWVVGVGALKADASGPAAFSNRGSWVDVYAPGEDLINAYATGTYRCEWDPNTGTERSFQGMARWSGTSYATPLVAGLIAARMSATGETAPQAKEELLAIARQQEVPGAGPALLPDQKIC